MTPKDILRRTAASLLVALCVCMTLSQSAQGADWRLLGKDTNDCQWFYDGGNLKYLPERKVLVWLKRLANDEQRKQKGYEHWGFEMGLMELDCAAVTIRQLSVTDYDQEGKFLKARKIIANETAIARNSMAEAVYRNVCALRGPGPEGILSPLPRP